MEKRRAGRPKGKVKKLQLPEDLNIEQVKGYKADKIEEYALPIPVMQKRVKTTCGPKYKDIDLELLFKLSKTILPVSVIANILGCHKDVIDKNYREILDRGRNERRHSLSQAMWYKALYERDTKMMIWLSKQHLGYKENPQESNANVSYNVYVNDVPVKKMDAEISHDKDEVQ